jgi:F-type H+-transporting ATPase subunit b
VLIDWFTVIAQIVNFLVLVALLKHFLWGRLTRAIDEREARVAGELAKAEEKFKEAERQTEQARLRSLEQERKRDEMMAQARKEAEDQRAKLVEEARNSVRELERKWHEELDRERGAFFMELRTRAATEIVAVIRRALGDLSSSDLQESTVQVFLGKLGSLDVATLREVVGAKEQVVRSAVDLPEETRKRIGAILQARLGASPQLRFEKDSTMAWGIELRGNGHKIGWAPESYLDSLEENLKQALERRTEAIDRDIVQVKDE